MNLLLDTHILLWALTDDPKLPPAARKMIGAEENEIFFSIISEWEVEIKHILHPLEMTIGSGKMADYCRESGYRLLALGERDIALLSTLRRSADAPRHKDPFDRMLICQAKSNDMVLITHDHLFQDYHESCVITM